MSMILCTLLWVVGSLKVNEGALVLPSSCFESGNGTDCCSGLHQQCLNLTNSLFKCTLSETFDISNLTMHKCRLAEMVPSELCELTSLTYLDLSSNEFKGPLPNNIGNLTHLTHLDLSQNAINGSIPNSMENITDLVYLKMSDNQLSQMNAQTIAQLTKLKHLDLSMNKISDDLDTAMGNLVNLVYLDLSENYIDSGIPSSFESLANVQFFGLHNNYIDGSLPSYLVNFTNLSTVLLDYNEFSGYIPSTYGAKWTAHKLNTLYLGHNNDLYCPIDDYSGYAIYTDYISSYGSNGTANCAPAPTPAPTQQEDLSETGLDGVEIALIVLMIIFVLGLVAYCWRERRSPSRYTDLGDNEL